jgi:hypothetical protein
MQNGQKVIKETPWYRIGMVWLMIALPVIAVVASLITVGIAHQNAPSIIPKSIEIPRDSGD